MPSSQQHVRTLVLAVSAGVAMSNGFSLQPLLPDISKSFSVGTFSLGFVAAAPQLGYTLGLLFLTPLGDRYNRKKMAYYQFIGLALCLFISAITPSLWVFLGASLVMGIMMTIVIHLNSFAANIASPEHRSQAVGIVATGVALGILGGRVVGGMLGQHLGWRVMLAMSGVLVLFCAVAIHFLLPDEPSKPVTPYRDILRSLIPLFRRSHLLKEASFAGGGWFAAFSAFWACLAAHLAQSPFYFGPQQAGLFGLVGIAGALSSRSAGRWADRIGARKVIITGVLTAFCAFVLMWYFNSALWALILGVLLVDVGLFSSQVANQARVLSLDPNARSRLYSLYMFLYYGAGAIGAAVSFTLLEYFGWSAVCAFCLGLTFISALTVGIGARSVTRDGC
ncbi:MFS transporter [Saccharibacter sp. 17.LH.SD]|uniref:MFS transporter n=1 Tax=Saccharibacter sp. 17.LH.SD TaxID=2689393 RepID=UPI001369EA6B|nr:MFS transporter [Saccharibacter sp. 17.LH.SD]MXV43522.1 MFS transporter [Saccharibacter sp. 17.LH.SD]